MQGQDYNRCPWVVYNTVGTTEEGDGDDEADDENS